MILAPESHHFDRKSLRLVVGSTADFASLAADCVCFANGAGGALHIGIEDDADAPPPTQRIDPGLLDKLRRRVGELTVNVQVVPELRRHENGGEYVVLAIPRAAGVASTSDGRYFLRVGDTCRPVVGDDVMRLATERPAVPWETVTSLGVTTAMADAAKVASIVADLRASDRVKAAVKEKDDAELLVHYALADQGRLTNLGVLLVGRQRTARALAPPRSSRPSSTTTAAQRSPSGPGTTTRCHRSNCPTPSGARSLTSARATSCPTACCGPRSRRSRRSSSASCSSTRSCIARTRSAATST